MKEKIYIVRNDRYEIASPVKSTEKEHLIVQRCLQDSPAIGKPSDALTCRSQWADKERLTAAFGPQGRGFWQLCCQSFYATGYLSVEN
ncbi:hypothetical protein CEXT_278691 [Caerostris extrusa]|uniref:Uncharacterized protein n=1 Tax=Caerostris extrusa TaxID=172846 RepID=A0AAV4MFP9_CAEEX|nr:hypothetical protein CEXT_278691 [Caerostris extrusa]